jgi:predicted dehydrogenase
MHLEWTLKALAAGKHVLCEKPLACNADEARQMAAAAGGAGLVLMEAYMSAFHPRRERVIDLARSGALGELRAMVSSFTFPNRDETNYRWLPTMGGGALLDVGIYCLEPLVAIAGEPVGLAATQTVARSGVDATFAGWLTFEKGISGSLLVSFEAPEEQSMEIVGTEGWLRVRHAFTAGESDTRIEITRRNGTVEGFETQGADPYLAMVEHFAAAVRGLEAPRRSLDASIATLAVLGRLRAAAAGDGVLHAGSG